MFFWPRKCVPLTSRGGGIPLHPLPPTINKPTLNTQIVSLVFSIRSVLLTLRTYKQSSKQLMFVRLFSTRKIIKFISEHPSVILQKQIIYELQRKTTKWIFHLRTSGHVVRCSEWVVRNVGHPIQPYNKENFFKFCRNTVWLKKMSKNKWIMLYLLISLWLRHIWRLKKFFSIFCLTHSCIILFTQLTQTCDTREFFCYFEKVLRYVCNLYWKSKRIYHRRSN